MSGERTIREFTRQDALAEMRRAAARPEPLLAEPWSERAQPDAGAAHEVLDDLRAEAAGGQETGLRAAMVDGALTITHRYVLVHTSPA